MTEYKHKMVGGELVELTPAEIAELEELAANPPPSPYPESVDWPAKIAALEEKIEALQAAVAKRK